MPSIAEIPVFFSRFFPWPFIWTGGYIACGAVREIYRACGSKRWPTVEGIVSETRILTTDVGEDCVREVFIPSA